MILNKKNGLPHPLTEAAQPTTGFYQILWFQFPTMQAQNVSENDPRRHRKLPDSLLWIPF
jgi:hypothetical protein